MGFFSDSDSTTKKRTETQTANQGFSDIGEGAQAVGLSAQRGSKVDLNLTDHGAVREAFKFGRHTVDRTAAALDTTQDTVRQSTQKFMQGLESFAKKQATQSDERLATMAAITILGLGAVSVFKNRKGA